MVNCRTKIRQIKTHARIQTELTKFFFISTQFWLSSNLVRGSSMSMIFSTRVSRKNPIWECECFEWLKFEKLRQSERRLLLFLCLFRPLSKAQLKFWYTQPSHFCTQIRAARFSTTITFSLRFACAWQYGTNTLHLCSPVCIVSRLSVLRIQWTQLTWSHSALCALLYARTVLPVLTPQHTPNSSTSSLSPMLWIQADGIVFIAVPLSHACHPNWGWLCAHWKSNRLARTLPNQHRLEIGLFVQFGVDTQWMYENVYTILFTFFFLQRTRLNTFSGTTTINAMQRKCKTFSKLVHTFYAYNKIMM